MVPKCLNVQHLKSRGKNPSQATSWTALPESSDSLSCLTSLRSQWTSYRWKTCLWTSKSRVKFYCKWIHCMYATFPEFARFVNQKELMFYSSFSWFSETQVTGGSAGTVVLQPFPGSSLLQLEHHHAETGPPQTPSPFTERGLSHPSSLGQLNKWYWKGEKKQGLLIVANWEEDQSGPGIPKPTLKICNED